MAHPFNGRFHAERCSLAFPKRDNQCRKRLIEMVFFGAHA